MVFSDNRQEVITGMGNYRYFYVIRPCSNKCIRPGNHEVPSFLHHLTLVIGTTDLVSKGMCHLPLDNFVVDLEHLLTSSQSKVPEPMSSGQTLVSHLFDMGIQRVLVNVLILPAPGTEEDVLVPSIELPQLFQHLL